MNRHARAFLALGALAAALAVVLGAAASHALAGRLADTQALFQVAMQYHQFHALGLLAVGLVAARLPTSPVVAAGWLMVAGLLLFSGNLYLRSLAHFHDWHALTPFGGGAFVLAWLALTFGVLAPREAADR